MNLSELDIYLSQTLQHSAWAARDKSMNGLQVGRRESEVHRVAFAVDASLQSFERAVAVGAQMLVVHHGLFWGSPLAVTGDHRRRLQYLFDHDLALWASHLPLDAHPTLGNNAGMAQALGLTDVVPFGEYRGAKIGCKGVLPAPQRLDQLCEVLFHGRENVLQILPFGKSEVSTVGLVSGGAPYEVADAIAENLDVYITGDAAHTIYHQALEAGINVIHGGHYATETWGVRLLTEHLQKEKGVPSVFVDLPTGL
jgi:dinuclear metal center YbgI/SA1388 family protein